MKILSHIIKLRVSLLFGNAGLSTLTKIIYGILLLISIVYGFCLSLLFEYLVDQNLLKVSKALLTFNILNAFSLVSGKNSDWFFESLGIYTFQRKTSR